MPGALLFQGEGDTNVGIGEARGSTASLMTTWRLLKRRAKADAFPLGAMELQGRHRCGAPRADQQLG